jgi:virginiamycin B lyase
MWLYGLAATAHAGNPLERFYIHGAEMPSDPVRGPDGAVWMTSLNGLVRVPADGSAVVHPTRGLTPFSLTAGPDGALWFTDLDGAKVGRMDLNGGLSVFSRGFPSEMQLLDITSGADGNLWLADFDGSRIMRLTPAGHVTVMAQLPSLSSPRHITAAPDGTIGFADDDGVGFLRPSGDLKRVPLTRYGEAGSTTFDSDGNLWASLVDVSAIVRVTPAGEGDSRDYPATGA